MQIEEKMTKAQKDTYYRLVKQHGLPDSKTHYTMGKETIILLGYPFGVIGIEEDGYAHM